MTFGLDWKAEAEYGGFYQAVAAGIYAKHGLDVTIEQGGPQINHITLLMAGRLQFNLSGGQALQQHLPFIAVAAIFQKDPSVLIAHPGVGNDSFEGLKGKPIESPPLCAAAGGGSWQAGSAIATARSDPTRSDWRRS